MPCYFHPSLRVIYYLLIYCLTYKREKVKARINIMKKPTNQQNQKHNQYITKSGNRNIPAHHRMDSSTILTQCIGEESDLSGSMASQYGQALWVSKGSSVQKTGTAADEVPLLGPTWCHGSKEGTWSIPT